MKKHQDGEQDDGVARKDNVRPWLTRLLWLVTTLALPVGVGAAGYGCEGPRSSSSSGEAPGSGPKGVPPIAALCILPSPAVDGDAGSTAAAQCTCAAGQGPADWSAQDPYILNASLGCEHPQPQHRRAEARYFSLNGMVTEAGESLQNVHVVKGRLVGEVLRADGKTTLLQDTDWRKRIYLRGALRCIDAEGMVPIDARILDVTEDIAETSKYRLEIKHPTTGHWTPACGDHPSVTAQKDTNDSAIPIPGFWDDSGAYHPDAPTFALACTDSAASKCYHDWRYHPWQSLDGGTETMSSLFLACVRMARADYCGDGTSHTVEGTCVDEWDVAGIDREDGGAHCDGGDASLEAAWSVSGAVCADHLRWKNLPGDPPDASVSTLCGKRPLPACTSRLGAPRGSLIFDRSSTNVFEQSSPAPGTH